jgi:hypothetical protein
MRIIKALLAGCVIALSVCINSALCAPETGWWWNPAESGRGFFIESRDGVTFIGAYSYDNDGHASWLVAGGPNNDPYSYTGDLYYKTKGESLFGAYSPPGPAVVVGALSVRFTDDTHGTLTWPGGTIAIQRHVFGGTVAPFQPFSGWWWNPDEQGTGYSVELQGNNLFIVGFMYDDDGGPVWYYSAGPMNDATTYSGDLLLFANGQTMAGPYRPPDTPTKVATLDVSFIALNEATFSFSSVSPSATSARFSSVSRSGTSATKHKAKKQTTQFPKPGTYRPPQRFTGQLTHRLNEFTDSTIDISSVDLDPLVWTRNDTPPATPYENYVITQNVRYARHTGSSRLGEGAHCDSFAADGPKPVTAGALGSLLLVNKYQKYTLYIDLPAEGMLGDETCTFMGITETHPTILGIPGTQLSFEGAVVNDKIQGGGIGNNSGPFTVTDKYSWDFSAFRPTP